MGLAGIPRLLRGRIDTPGARLAWHLFLATIPVIIFGAAIKVLHIDALLRSVALIGWTMLGFGIVLYWADKTGTTEKSDQDWTLRDTMIMGVAQAIALIPGTSRSGITITAARRLGYNRHAAAKLSMLMSIPTIIASGALLGVDVIGQANWILARNGAIAAVFAMIAALGALSIMMRLLNRINYTPYVIYRIALGVLLLIYAYT